MPILAYYTIRSKQAYIFSSNRMIEIRGASRLISEAFDLLFEAAEEAGLAGQRASIPFTLAETLAEFQAGRLQMNELFCGGGNCTVLFDSEESWKAANGAWTRRILEKAPGMIPMSAGIPTQCANYPDDWQKLQEAVERQKNRMMPWHCEPMLPFSLTDRVTGAPITDVNKRREYREMDAAAMAKFDKGVVEDPTELDEMVYEKGIESLLAVVHIDGNGMGRRIQARLRENGDYDSAVKTMRAFTDEIRAAFGIMGKRAVKEEASALDDKDERKKVRWLIEDGDDVTFICNARYVLRLTKAFLKALSAGSAFSACAGICVFHSHYPFHMAYELAEEACDNAKTAMRKAGSAQEGCFVDFHFMRSGAGTSLKTIREQHDTAELIARPLRVGVLSAPDAPSLEQLEELCRIFKDKKVGRGNVKALGVACEQGTAAFDAEWSRICSRVEGVEEAVRNLVPDIGSCRRLIYDLSEYYDLWFAAEQEGGET